MGARRLLMLVGLWAIFFVESSTGSQSSDAVPTIVLDDGLEVSTKVGKDKAIFDYYVFSQQWPGSYCKRKGTCCSNVVLPATFTVHGLWPENEDGSWPSCCDGPDFDQDKVSELEDLLEQYWPTLSCRSPRQCSGRSTGSFWQHEWEKHGTCSYPYIPDEATYFSVGLNLRMKYDITKIFTEAGFPPSKRKYRTSDLLAALEDSVGAQPLISCTGNFINEVWICFTKDLKIRDCGVTSNSCGRQLEIPPFTLRSELDESM